MRLESVRSLKAEIFEQALTHVHATRKLLRDEVAARKSALPATEPPPSIALGIEGNRGNYRLAVRIQAATPGMQTNIDRILTAAHGEASVKVVGRVVKQHSSWQKTKLLPLRIGCSVGHSRITVGTLGGFVELLERAGPCILSNNHVLADENRASLGDPILQPSLSDGGRSPQDEVAILAKLVPLTAGGKNLVDAAAAILQENISADFGTLTGQGALQGVRSEPLEGQERVFKIGRTTGLTQGHVSAFEVDDVWIQYDIGLLGFDRQIEIAPVGGSPFSLGGDSGSLVVDESLRAVGLLFAGNDVDVSYANPIQAVLETLGARML
jgi:hypothetical protein